MEFWRPCLLSFPWEAGVLPFLNPFRTLPKFTPLNWRFSGGRRSDPTSDFGWYTAPFCCFWVVSVLSFNQDRKKELLERYITVICLRRYALDA
jgi:hypothetical protein